MSAARRPTGEGWREIPVDARVKLAAEEAFHFVHLGFNVSVLSCVEMVEKSDGSRIPERHVSFVMLDGRRAPRAIAKAVRRAFAMEDAEEDNHVPGGFVRNLWLPFPEIGPCDCADEPETLHEVGEGATDESGDVVITREVRA